jgi:hypothetical protein
VLGYAGEELGKKLGAKMNRAGSDLDVLGTDAGLAMEGMRQSWAHRMNAMLGSRKLGQAGRGRWTCAGLWRCAGDRAGRGRWTRAGVSHWRGARNKLEEDSMLRLALGEGN